MEVASQETFAAMRQKRIDQMAQMRHQISSPKLREMLKEKCRIRIKESRQHMHDGRRLLDPVDRKTFMSKILKEEIFELEKDLEKQEQIFREIMEEADQWLYEEMELAEEIAIDRLLDGDNIFCPVCQKSNLECLADSIISCACGIRFAFKEDLKTLYSHIVKLIAKHETACPSQLQFFAEPSPKSTPEVEFSSLNAYCASCEFCSTLIV